MHFLTSLIIVIGFGFVICLGLVKMIRDLSRLSIHESPAIRESFGNLAAEKTRAVESYESNPTELSDTH
jgi:hypothetical protein